MLSEIIIKVNKNDTFSGKNAAIFIFTFVLNWGCCTGKDLLLSEFALIWRVCLSKDTNRKSQKNVFFRKNSQKFGSLNHRP